METKVVGRFAPSPSGYLHLGNLLSLLLAWLDCRALGGELVFRMEDLDPARSRADYARAIAEDLRWLGLDWDRGWPDEDYAQSRRTARYEEVFRELRSRGLVYPCWCSRAERLAAASAPHPGEAEHDGACRCRSLSPKEREERLRSGRPPAWKLRSPTGPISLEDGHYGLVTADLARDMGDCIVRRADGVFAYQLAVSADDRLMGVTRVVRGRDLLPSALRQKWLIETLGGTAPSYCHAPLLVGADGGKLSKRLGSLSTQELRRTMTPEALIGRLAFLCGLLEREEPVSARELLTVFSWDKVVRADIPLND
ncbi:MAG: tRNA glutamyl-Q(34) synthetase GluQRS [Oscillospiraceae bacterium]|nr:tRNA glutamyl-Q(34) synthetase GluQRS [Oscillospiraceae bacterium]